VDNFCNSYRNSINSKILRTLTGRIIVLIVLVIGAPLMAEEGHWSLIPQVIEVPQGGIIDPSHPGAVPYRGIEEIRFLKGDVVSIVHLGQEYSAFIEVIPGDGGDRWVLTFPDGRSLSILTYSDSPGSMLFLYRYGEDFFPNPLKEEIPMEMKIEMEIEMKKAMDEGVEVLMDTDLPLIEMPLDEEVEESELPLVLVSGRMTKL